MIPVEYGLILELLHDHLDKKKSSRVIEGLCDNEFETIISLAKQQQICGIVSYQLKDYITKNASNSKGLYLAQVVQQAKYDNELRFVTKLLKDIGVEFCIVKGPKVAEYYPVPELRSMGDIDILIHSKDRIRVDTILTKNGFIHINGGNDEWTYQRNSTVFEIHDQLVHPHPGNKNIVEYFKKIWEFGTVIDYEFIPSWDFHFVYLIQHLSGHFLITGVGIRQFLDIAVIVKNVELDWSWIEHALKKLQLWDFCLLCLGFCKKVFELDIASMPYREIDDQLFNDTIAKIFTDGVFGQLDKDNVKYSQIMISQFYQRKTLKRIFVKDFLSTAFPSYGKMKLYPHCQFVENRKYLLPIGWMVRYFILLDSMIRKRKKYALVTVIDPKDKEILKRHQFLSKWGF